MRARGEEGQGWRGQGGEEVRSRAINSVGVGVHAREGGKEVWSLPLILSLAAGCYLWQNPASYALRHV